MRDAPNAHPFFCLLPFGECNTYLHLQDSIAGPKCDRKREIPMYVYGNSFGD